MSSNLKERVLDYLEKRKQNIVDGNINSIPSPFTRFSEDFLGIEQGMYYLITASTKASKTQLSSFIFIYNTLMYSYNNPEKATVKIFYYPLEETPEEVMIRFMSYILYTLNKEIRISPKDLKSSNNKKPLSNYILEILKSEEYTKILNHFQDNIVFSNSTNPTGVWKEMVKYAEDNGTTYKKKIPIKDDFGNSKIIETFDYYVSNNPKEYRIVYFDHVSLINTEKGMTLKQSIDKLSEYMVTLRNHYNYTPVIIQQQSMIGESLEAFKEGKLSPSIANLSDSKYPARDCQISLGIFSPFKHSLPEYMGYNIKKFRDNIRFLEVLINRSGSPGGICPLYFDGAVNFFSELPLPTDTAALQQIYDYLDKLRGKTNKSFFVKNIKTIKKILKYNG